MPFEDYLFFGAIGLYLTGSVAEAHLNATSEVVDADSGTRFLQEFVPAEACSNFNNSAFISQAEEQGVRELVLDDGTRCKVPALDTL